MSSQNNCRRIQKDIISSVVLIAFTMAVYVINAFAYYSAAVINTGNTITAGVYIPGICATDGGGKEYTMNEFSDADKVCQKSDAIQFEVTGEPCVFTVTIDNKNAASRLPFKFTLSLTEITASGAENVIIECNGEQVDINGDNAMLAAFDDNHVIALNGEREFKITFKSGAGSFIIEFEAFYENYKSST